MRKKNKTAAESDGLRDDEHIKNPHRNQGRDDEYPTQTLRKTLSKKEKEERSKEDSGIGL